jgi:hypothetical protein
MNTRTGNQKARATRVEIGHRIGGWTVERMIEDGPTVNDRRWIIVCDCGYKARKYEGELSASGYRLTACTTCRSGTRRDATKAGQP